MKNKVTNSQNQSQQTPTKPSLNDSKSKTDNSNFDMSVNQPTFKTGVVVSLATDEKGSQRTGRSNFDSGDSAESVMEYIHKPIHGHLLENVKEKGLEFYCKGSFGNDGKGTGINDVYTMDDKTTSEEERELKRIKRSDTPVIVEI